MRFDNIAMAANTPGGFQAGVNDMVQALMGAKRQQAQQALQEAQMQQQMAIADRSFGAEQAQRLSSNEFREREISANELRARTDATQSAAQNANLFMDNIGSVGKYIGDKLIPDAKAGPGSGPVSFSDQLRQREYTDKQAKDLDTQDRLEADQAIGLSGDKMAYEENDPIMTGVLQDKPLLVDGKPQFKKTWKTRLAGPEDYAAARKGYDIKRDARKNPQSAADAMSQARGEVIPPQRQASGTPGMGTAVAQSLAPNTGDTNGLSQNEAPVAQAPVIDYAAEDARLQATNEKYRQLRANPSYNWRKAIDDSKAAQVGRPTP